MYVVPAHRVYAVGVPVHDVLVVEEELVRLHQLRLALRQLIRGHLVLQDVVELQIVVTDRLAPEHNHRVRIHHVQAHQPDLLLSHYMDDLPVAPLSVQLLDGGTVRKGLIAHCIDIALCEGAAVGPSHSLRELRECLLPLALDVKALTLSQIVALERAADDKDLILLLGNAEVNSIVHHFS